MGRSCTYVQDSFEHDGVSNGCNSGMRIAAAILLRGLGRVSAGNVLHVAVAGRDVALWKPAGPQPASGYPVVLSSHGYTGCNTQSTVLMQALAGVGCLVLAPNHKDAVCGTAWHPGKLLTLRPQEPFLDASQWSATYKDRDVDIESVLDAVLRGPSFRGVPIDRERVGIAGHSLGGYTMLLAGGWPSWKDGRIKAVLAFSPHCSPYIAKGGLGHKRRRDVPGGARSIWARLQSSNALGMPTIFPRLPSISWSLTARAISPGRI